MANIYVDTRRLLLESNQGWIFEQLSLVGYQDLGLEVRFRSYAPDPEDEVTISWSEEGQYLVGPSVSMTLRAGTFYNAIGEAIAAVSFWAGMHLGTKIRAEKDQVRGKAH